MRHGNEELFLIVRPMRAEHKMNWMIFASKGSDLTGSSDPDDVGSPVRKGTGMKMGRRCGQLTREAISKWTARQCQYLQNAICI